MSVVIILPNQGSWDYRLCKMPYRRERFKACMHACIRPSVRPSVRPSIHPSIHPSARLFIHSFSNVIIKFKILYSVPRSTEKTYTFDHGKCSKWVFSRNPLFYRNVLQNIKYLNSLRRMAFYRCSQLFFIYSDFVLASSSRFTDS